MAFVETRKSIYNVGDRVKTAEKHENMVGYFEIGTEVKIIGIGDRGYDIEDKEGNRVLEIGWTI